MDPCINININKSCCQSGDLPTTPTGSSLPFRSLTEFDTVVHDPTHSIDQTDAFQAVIDELADLNADGYPQRATALWLPPWSIALKQVRYYSTTQIWGSGIGGRGSAEVNGGVNTAFYQFDGVAQGLIDAGKSPSLFVNDPIDLPIGNWWHYAQFRNFALRKLPGGVDTVGSGFEINCRAGELFTIEQISSINFPEDGIHFKHGCTTCKVSQVSTHQNGRYGVHLERSGSDTYHGTQLGFISGDNNGRALVGVTLGGADHDIVYIDGLKSESRTPGTQPYAVETNNFHGKFLVMNNVSFSNNGGGAQAILGINGVNTAGYRLQNIAADRSIPYYIQDNVASVTVPNDTASFDLGYSNGQVKHNLVRWP